MALKFETLPFRNPTAVANWRAFNDIFDFFGDTAPVDGVTGKGALGRGSTYMDVSKGFLYTQTGTIDSPVWTRS